ncbi:MAG: hypothetical protein NAOJABEB_02045 [Steroidobacteraceae bacterium]|nr:hypothetical protein [Steroidobacteraceae bacterium]
MLRNFQLTAIIRQGGQVRLQRIPMHQALQRALTTSWGAQLDAFLDEAQEISFDAGYQPEGHERFALQDFEPPEWLARESSATIDDLSPIEQDEASIASIKALAGFARGENGNELILYQNFSRSHVIRPGAFLLLRNGTYETAEHPGLTLDIKLAAVHFPAEQKLLFRNFRTVNTFLPLGDFYDEASEQQIREILAHDKLAPVNVEAIATESNQWFRKRFALLRDSGVLDKYTAKEIRRRSKGYDVEIQMQRGKIVFPEDRPAAKKLLQFLNEELFRGAITETLYETNSKREAD